MLKDYKHYSLHEHIFDGVDDLRLSKLDMIFDSPAFDS